MPIGLVRSALFVPANRPDWADKALEGTADAIILDLEDSLPPSEKPKARGLVRRRVAQPANRLILVRVNALGSGFLEGDLEEIVAPGLPCIIVPKVNQPEQLDTLHGMLLNLERERGLREGSLSVIPFLECGRAVEQAHRILTENSCRERLVTAAFGAADYTLDLGVELTRDARELDYARFRIGVACRAAGVARPLDSPYLIDIHDLEGLKADAIRSRQAGFQGKLCIHPKQVEICNQVFSPSPAEVARARRAIQAFRTAESQGRGAIQFEGMMVDYPVLRRFMSILDLANQPAHDRKESRGSDDNRRDG